MSSRTPVFRAFPRAGHPAPLRHLGDLLAPGRADDARRARSRTTPTCGGTSARTRTSARSRRGSSTSRRGSSTRSALAALTSRSPTGSSALYDDERAAGRVPDRADRRQQGPRRACAGMDGDADRLLRAASRCRAEQMARGVARRGSPSTPRSSAARAELGGVERPARRRHRRPPPARDLSTRTATTCATLVARDRRGTTRP